MSEDQKALQDSITRLLEKECNPSVVRRAEPAGFDLDLWVRITSLDLARMGVPSESGGDGAGLEELVVVSEVLGRYLAPVPFAETVAAVRLLAACGDTSGSIEEACAGRLMASVMLNPLTGVLTQLVPAGSLGGVVLAWSDDHIAQREMAAQPVVPNIGCLPLGKVGMAGSEWTPVLAGDEAHRAFDQAVAEWKVLTAAALVGLAQGALDLALAYARDRLAFGVAIGSFQAISHPLVDAASSVASARRLVGKAAWFLEHERDRSSSLVSMAFLHAAETANRCATVGIHVQGGFGFTLESDMQLFFRRAKGWALMAGDPQNELRRIAADLLGPEA